MKFLKLATAVTILVLSNTAYSATIIQSYGFSLNVNEAHASFGSDSELFEIEHFDNSLGELNDIIVSYNFAGSAQYSFEYYEPTIAVFQNFRIGCTGCATPLKSKMTWVDETAFDGSYDTTVLSGSWSNSDYTYIDSSYFSRYESSSFTPKLNAYYNFDPETGYGKISAGVSGGVSITYDYTPVSAVPVPAAVWLFGSGLLGLVGIARRKKA